MTDIQEFVVPKSIPRILLILFFPFVPNGIGWVFAEAGRVEIQIANRLFVCPHLIFNAIDMPITEE